MIKKRIEIKKKIKVILEKHHLSALLPHMHSPLPIVSVTPLIISLNFSRVRSAKDLSLVNLPFPTFKKTE